MVKSLRDVARFTSPMPALFVRVSFALGLLLGAAQANEPITLVGKAVGREGHVTVFWRRYQQIRQSRDRAAYELAKRAKDPLEFALAIYLAPQFSDRALLEASLADTRVVRYGRGCIISNERLGTLAYRIVRERSEAFVPPEARYSKEQRVSLARTILGSPMLALLHRDAGAELRELGARPRRR